MVLHRGASRPRARREETVPNLVPETEKNSDSALCSDSRNTANASNDPCPDTSAAIVEDIDCGQERDRNYIPVDEIWCRKQKHSFLDSIKGLTIESEKLGCAFCKTFDILGPYMKQGQHMSKEWASSQIALTVEKSGYKRSRANLKAIGNKKFTGSRKLIFRWSKR